VTVENIIKKVLQIIIFYRGEREVPKDSGSPGGLCGANSEMV
jgi:hypothetical protein